MSRRVLVTVSDPWSFVDENGSNVFEAQVVDSHAELLLVLMRGQHYAAQPRSEDHSAFWLTPVAAPLDSTEPPWGRDDWRGSPTALLAEVRSA